MIINLYPNFTKKSCRVVTLGTAAWNTKSVITSCNLFVKLASITVVCGFPGCFEKLNVNFMELLSNATTDGYAGPLSSVAENQDVSICERINQSAKLR